MKVIKYIPYLLSLILALSACTDDDKTIYNPNATEPGRLNEIASSYVFDVTEAANVFETFAWGETTYNFNAAVRYILQADIEGNNFTGSEEEVASTNGLTTSVTVGNMNRIMIRLQMKYGLPDASRQNVEFRIKATAGDDATAQYTNVIKTSITSYSAEPEYPKVWVIGDYCGWGHGASQFLFDYTGSNTYEGWIFFDGKAANGFKITGEANWDNGNFGLADGDTPNAEASSITLYDGGPSKNIEAYSKKYYKFSFNKSTLELANIASMDYFGIIGSGAGGWGDNDDIPFEFDNKTQSFVATVTLSDGEIKFRADHKWDFNFGQLKDGAEGTLAAGGENIAVAAGTYKITVKMNNSNEMTYKIESGTAIDPNKITPQVLNAHDDVEVNQNGSDAISWSALSFGDQNPATVNYTVEIDLKGASFTNAQVLGTTRDTSLSVSGDKLLEALTALGKGIDTPTDVDVRVTATVSGITNVFTSNVVSYKLTVKTPPVYPEELYMTGDDFGGWFGDQSGVVKMTPVHSAEGEFWTIRYFTANNGFKWAPQPSWDGGDFAELGSKEGYDVNSGNAIVTTSGLYIVYINMSEDKITIEPAKVYGMGDCFGSWDAGTHLFSVTDGKASYTTTATGELRIYAGSSAATTDWWTREFILRDGIIEYRGSGGDQEPRVVVDAGKKITLDFNAGTGTIE